MYHSVLVSVGGTTGADGGRDNPDPRRGKLERQEVWSKAPNLGGVLLSTAEYTWRAYWFLNGVWDMTPRTVSRQNSTGEYPPTWLRQEAVKTTVGTATNESRQFYEPFAQAGYQYGNVTLMEEWADNVKLRATRTDYRPNIWAHIVSLPARVRVYSYAGGQERCVSETRNIYDQWSWPNNDFLAAPAKGLVSETAKALASCSDAWRLNTDDRTWQMERFAYDAYGNQTVHHYLAATDGSPDRWTHTDYDAVYHLFPIKMYDAGRPEFAEQASYYGVNAITSGEAKDWNDAWYYWGAMAEWCDVNDVCVRQAYDSHGRRTLRWDNVLAGVAWSSNTADYAAVQWAYRDPLNNGGWHDVTVTEWRNPRCEGNFIRRHYDGFGQLTQEQRPNGDWSTNTPGCNGVAAGAPEIDVDYLYDGLGRQYAASVPHPTTLPWINRPADWNYGSTITRYDALDRVTRTYAPNGEEARYYYSGRRTKVTGIGRDTFANKVLQWTELDGLGYLRYVWSGDSSGSDLARVTLTHDVLGNLTAVDQPGVGVTTITYDLGGRKVQMTDPALGTWRYNYNRQGQLLWQTDANGWTTCLYYDGLGRLSSQYFQQNITCNGASGSGRRTLYAYDANHSASNRSRGQLTSVAKYDGSNALSYRRTQRYDGVGRLAAQTAQAGASGAWTTSYRYDGYSRLWATVYPDGEQVMVGYGSMGLPVKLVSSDGYDLVDGGAKDGTHTDAAQYDAAGRLVQARFPAGGNLWRTALYNPWVSSDGNGNGRLGQLLIGTAAWAGDRYQANQGYDSYGNLLWRSEFVGGVRQADYSFQYDDQNRVSNGWYGRYAPGDVLTYAANIPYTYDEQGSWPVKFEPSATLTRLRGHFAALASGDYLFDGNGNVARRTGQVLSWDAENHLAQINFSSDTRTEWYTYDERGVRVSKTEGTPAGQVNATTWYLFPHYERKQTGTSAAVATKYYYFDNMLIAKRTGSTLTYLHTDLLGSVLLETNSAGAVVNDQRYYAYGRRFDTGGSISGERDFTGQNKDATDLLYYNARYYDPRLGQFLSPDTIVPDPSSFLSYNRYLYANGNPLKYNDPSGHEPCPACFIPLPNSLLVEQFLADWGLNPMVFYFLPPALAGETAKVLQENDLPAPTIDPALELAADWYFEQGEQSRTYGPDFSVTKALIHDEGVEQARQKYINGGRQDLRQSDGTWHRYSFGLLAAGRELVGDTLAKGDWSTSFLGGYEVEVLTIETTDTDSLVEFRVHNQTSWSSATRVWSFRFKENEERWLPGPGGNLDQVYIWQERLPQ